MLPEVIVCIIWNPLKEYSQVRTKQLTQQQQQQQQQHKSFKRVFAAKQKLK
jgi:hypothetical protein